MNPRTIRYYEAIGVLPASARSQSGYRIYSQEAVKRLEFVLKAKALGLTLDEIKTILSLHDEGVAPCEHTRDFIKHKITEIDGKLKDLVSLKKTLSRVLKIRFKKHAAAGFCPLIEETEKPKKTGKSP